MGPEYFGFDARRWSADVRFLEHPRVGLGWGRLWHHAEPSYKRTRYLNVWLLTCWLRLEFRDR